MTTTRPQIPVLLLTGYLGSGKTTLLNNILANERGLRFAVIVNDIGEVNIDASLIRKEGIVGGTQQSDDLVALQNGCICCTLKMDLVEQLADLVAMQTFDYIVIEASGICEPAPIAQTICSIPRMAPEYSRAGVPRLDCIVTVVDALRLKSEFGCGNALDRKKIDDEDIENLIIEQIEFCNVILLNKVSEVTPDEAAHIRAVIRAIQPRARIIDTDYCRVDIEQIIGTGSFNFEDVATSAAWVDGIESPVTPQMEAEAQHHAHHHEHHHEHEHDHEHHNHDHDHGHDHDHCSCHHHHHDQGEAEEYGIGTMLYYRRQPFDLSRFDRFVAKEWPANIIRAKGVVYFSHNRDMSYLFEQAGVQKKLTEAGYWYATAPADELKAMMERDPALARDWDDTYGDRMIKLVFIGRDIDRDDLKARLDACLI